MNFPENSGFDHTDDIKCIIKELHLFVHIYSRETDGAGLSREVVINDLLV